MKPKITLVHFISSLEMGGAQAVLHDLVANLVDYQHHLIYIHNGPYKDRFEKMNIPVYAIAGFGPRGFFQLMRLLRKIRPDCMHTSLWGANWLGRIAAWWYRIPCVTVLHNNSQINGMVRQTLDRFAPAAHITVAVSQEVQKSFDYANMCVINNGVQRYGGASKSKLDIGLHNEHFVIGSVGRFHPDKQYDLLINSFALVAKKYDHARLVLLGGGAQERYLRQLVSALHLEEKVLFIVGQQAAPYYSLFDCFILTSKNEGISMAMLEAMSRGVVPLMACADTSHPVIVHMHNGFLVPHNPDAIAQAIMQMMLKVNDRTRMSDAAIETVQNHFDAQQMISAYNKIFRACQASHKIAPAGRQGDPSIQSSFSRITQGERKRS